MSRRRARGGRSPLSAAVTLCALLLAASLPGPGGAPKAAPAPTALRIAVLSDIHVYASGKVPERFTALVANVARLRPKLVILNGDTTSGNPKDRYSLRTTRRWWRSALAALEPLRAAGIPVLPVAGNHDFYRPAHRQAYAEAARELLAESLPRLGLAAAAGHAPYYYSIELEGVHLSLLHVVDQDLEPDVANWLVQDLAQATPGALKLAFGHVPLQSVMGHTNEGFKAQLGNLLAMGGAKAYVAGHEHLVWDEELRFGAGPLRQISVGTASGTYNYPPRADVRARYCKALECRMPYAGGAFRLRGDASGLELGRASLTVLDLFTAEAPGDEPRVLATPYLLDEPSGTLKAFYETDLGGHQ